MALIATLVSCAPQAIFFHESTKVGVAATYNVSDSQPLSSHFGFKRRIVAVVPGQERVPAASGKEEDATNQGDALSLVSKFYVKVGTRDQGIEIRNNFATGNAARALTASSNSSRAVEALMHNQVVVSPPTRTTMATNNAPVTTATPRRVPRAPTPSPTPASPEVTTPRSTVPPLPETPETPAPPVRATPTPPPSTYEVGPDGSVKPKPDK